MITVIIAVVGSSAMGAAVSGIFALIQNRKKHQDGVSKGVRQILYDRIKEKGRKYIADKEISSEDLEDLIHMHRIYHDDLDGNGYLDSLMEAVRKLPIVR